MPYSSQDAISPQPLDQDTPLDTPLPSLSFAQKIAIKAQEAAQKAQAKPPIAPLPQPIALGKSYSRYVNPIEESYLWDSDHLESLDPNNPQHEKFILLQSTEKLVVRFWSKVIRPLPTDDKYQSECWIWTGSLHTPTGTPMFGFPDPNGHGRNNRILTITGVLCAFVLITGVKPKGFGLRQACKSPVCVNPFHMAPHKQLPRLKIKRGRKPEGWKDPNPPRQFRRNTREAASVIDRRTQLGKKRWIRYNQLLDEGVPEPEAMEIVARLTYDWMGNLVEMPPVAQVPIAPAPISPADSDMVI